MKNKFINKRKLFQQFTKMDGNQSNRSAPPSPVFRQARHRRFPNVSSNSAGNASGGGGGGFNNSFEMSPSFNPPFASTPSRNNTPQESFNWSIGMSAHSFPENAITQDFNDFSGQFNRNSQNPNFYDNLGFESSNHSTNSSINSSRYSNMPPSYRTQASGFNHSCGTEFDPSCYHCCHTRGVPFQSDRTITNGFLNRVNIGSRGPTNMPQGPPIRSYSFSRANNTYCDDDYANSANIYGGSHSFTYGSTRDPPFHNDIFDIPQSSGRGGQRQPTNVMAMVYDHSDQLDVPFDHSTPGRGRSFVDVQNSSTGVHGSQHLINAATTPGNNDNRSLINMTPTDDVRTPTPTQDSPGLSTSKPTP